MTSAEAPQGELPRKVPGGGNSARKLRGEEKPPVAKLKPAKSKAAELPEEVLKRAKELFYEFDADGNGSIDAAEIKLVMKTLGRDLQPDEIQHMLDKVDANKSGSVDMREFLDMLTEGNDFLRGGHSADVSNALSLAARLTGGQEQLPNETQLEASAIKKILAEDFDLHTFRLDEVLPPGHVTVGSLRAFLCNEPMPQDSY